MTELLLLSLVIVVLVLVYNTRQVQQALAGVQRETGYFAVMREISYDAVLVLDDTMQVRACNKSAAALFGLPTLTDRKLSDFTASPELLTIVEGALATPHDVFEDQITINEHIYRAQARATPQGDHLLVGLALQDITQLVRLNRARRDMVANISHELRTPIANIRLIIDTLFHEEQKPRRKQSIASLRDIAKETDTLLWLAQELLDLSMIESGQAIMRLVETSLSELVETTIERMQDQTNASDLTVVSHVPDNLQVLCDPDQTRRVLINLLHNATKWSPPGETITVSAVENDEEITVSVLDNGPGVPDAQIDRVFERFYQVDASRSGHEGTGLGLAICKHIVEANGGHIWAEGSSKGGGRFLFTLLKAQTRAAQPVG